MVDGERIVKRAGIWPYVVLALGVVVVAVTHRLAVYCHAGHRHQEQARLCAAARRHRRPLSSDARLRPRPQPLLRVLGELRDAAPRRLARTRVMHDRPGAPRGRPCTFGGAEWPRCDPFDGACPARRTSERRWTSR